MATDTAITFSGVRTVGIPVADQDRALRFYQGTLGFEKRLDGDFAPGQRWLEVAPRRRRDVDRAGERPGRDARHRHADPARDCRRDRGARRARGERRRCGRRRSSPIRCRCSPSAILTGTGSSWSRPAESAPIRTRGEAAADAAASSRSDPGSCRTRHGGRRCRGAGHVHVGAPRNAERGQQPAVDAVVAGDLPGQDQADREGEHDRVRRRGAGEQERHVHQRAEEGGESGQDAEEQAQPTAISPTVISQANQPWALLSIRNWMKPRYHSKVIGGRAPRSGTLTAFCQKPSRAAPPSVQPVPVSLC